MNIYVFSGPCGCGKSTLADAYGRNLVESGGKNQVYVIHGDDFHRGFIETSRRVGEDCEGFQYWPDILRFNWECMLSVARKALVRGLDVIIDYVVEDELPLLRALAGEFQARLYYIVLTATEEELIERLMQRGSSDLIQRSLFLKQKLDHAPEHSAYLYDISGKTVAEEVAGLNMAAHEILGQ